MQARVFAVSVVLLMAAASVWFRDTEPDKIYPRGADGRLQKFNDLQPRYFANIDVADPPFNRQPGDAPAMTEHEEADIIAFINTLVDGYREK